MPRLPGATTLVGLLVAIVGAAHGQAGFESLDASAIAKAADSATTVSGDVVRIGWNRDDVAVTVDGMPFPPAAGLGSWAALKPIGMGQEAVVMGDTVVFQDEVDAAMDAAFAHRLEVTALHNHFFYDEPKVYFMHIGGHGPALELSSAVKAVWDAIKSVRAENAVPAKEFKGTVPGSNGKIDANLIEGITGLETTAQPGGVLKISKARLALMHGTEVGGSMGLASWAAFSGSNDLASMDGDFIMSADEVQPVLRALRGANVHVVALHNHMIDEQPAYFFTHFWAKGPVEVMAKGFRSALDAQQAVHQLN